MLMLYTLHPCSCPCFLSHLGMRCYLLPDAAVNRTISYSEKCVVAPYDLHWNMWHIVTRWMRAYDARTRNSNAMPRRFWSSRKYAVISYCTLFLRCQDPEPATPTPVQVSERLARDAPSSALNGNRKCVSLQRGHSRLSPIT